MQAYNICKKIKTLQNEIDDLLISLIDSDFISDFFSTYLDIPEDAEFNFETNFCSYSENFNSLFYNNEKIPAKKYSAMDGTTFYATFSNNKENINGIFYIPIDDFCISITWNKVN